MSKSPRWRITLDQLMKASAATAADIERWRRMGVMGGRFREMRDGGFASHITRPAARATVVMGRLVNGGVREDIAARAVISWHGVFKLAEDDIPRELTFTDGPVHVIVESGNLP